MATLSYPRFPSNCDSRVVLSKLRRTGVAVVLAAGHVSPDENQSVRGIEGLRPGVVAFPWVDVVKASTNDYQPLACIATEDPISGMGACYVSLDALDRCMFYIAEIAWGATTAAPAVPPQVNFEIRYAAGGVSDLAIGGTTAFISFEDRGPLAGASGILCTQWELWGRIDLAAPAGSRLRLKITGAADRNGGGSFVTGKGLLAA